jgi:ribosomal protein L12E/L44/L45/RPP1/RPP2
MFTVEELLAIINLSEAWLRRVLGTDEAYINRLVVIGIPRDEAERQSFRRDLINVLELMRSQNVSASRAARILGHSPEESSDEDQAEEEVEEEAEEEEEEEEEDETIEE